MKQRKKRKEPKDPFAFFKRATADAFRFFVDEYGFEKVSTNVHPPECEIKYQNETTGIAITYEWGGVIWVDVSRLTRTTTEVVEDEGYSLGLLMLECCPSRDINEFYPSEGESPDQYVERVLFDCAKVLKEYGTEILRGNFRLFPKLNKLAEEVLRQRNKEMFGSEAEFT